MTVFTQLKTHSDELNDFEATGPVIWGSLDTAVAALDLMHGLMATLKVKGGVMASLAGANFIQAAQLAETIAGEEKMGFRTAHKIVGRFVRNCIDRQIPPSGVQPEMVSQASVEVTGRPLQLSAQTLRRSMDVAFILRHRQTLGGPGRKQVLRMLKQRTLSLGRENKWLSAQQETIAGARRMTDALARRIAK